MQDPLNDVKAGETQEEVPSRKLGAFEFMADHHYDLVVIIRTADDDPRFIRRVELYYAERGMISSFVFDRTSKKFNNDPARAITSAMDQLMTEVRSRALSRHEFTVWYYSEEDLELVEGYAREHVKEHKTQQKHFRSLTQNSQIIGATDESNDSP